MRACTNASKQAPFGVIGRDLRRDPSLSDNWRGGAFGVGNGALPIPLGRASRLGHVGAADEEGVESVDCYTSIPRSVADNDALPEPVVVEAPSVNDVSCKKKKKDSQKKISAVPLPALVDETHATRVENALQLAERAVSVVDTLECPLRENYSMADGSRPSATLATFAPANEKHRAALESASTRATRTAARSCLIGHHAMLERACADVANVLATAGHASQVDTAAVMRDAVNTLNEAHVPPEFRTLAMDAMAHLLAEVHDLDIRSANEVLKHRREVWIANANHQYLRNLPDANGSHAIAQTLSAVIATSREGDLRYHAGQLVEGSPLLILDDEMDRQQHRSAIATQLLAACK